MLVDYCGLKRTVLLSINSVIIGEEFHLKVLVTGCAGFIGSRVISELTSQGHEVCGVDNLSDAYDVRMKEWRVENL